MNIQIKLLELQRGVKRQRIIIEEESDDEFDAELVHEQEEATIENDENNEPESEEVENEEDELIEFENGTTNKGNQCLWHKGFRYRHVKGPYWKCSNSDCKATAKVDENRDGILFGKLGNRNHNHLPEPQRKGAEKKRNAAKQAIREQPNKKKSKIVTETREGANLEVIAQMGTNRALDKMLFREREKLYGNVNCRNPLAIELPDALTTMDGETILLYDSRVQRPDQADVVLVFAHRKLLQLMKKRKKWVVDGTFSSSPAPWKQTFVFGAFVNTSQIVVCAQALLPGKDTKYYMEAMNGIKAAINASPLKIISDFERAILKASKAVFPATISMGCMFHFSQALYRKWCSMGFDGLMVDDDIGEKVRHTFRRVLALALIPIQHVRRAFALIIDDAPPNVSHFLLYFAETYIGFTEIELQIGANAFVPDVNIRHRRSTISNSAEERRSTISSDLRQIDSEHDYSGNIVFGRPSPHPSTPSMPTTAEETIPIRRWELDIVRKPMYEIRFWNVHDEALHALARTNNSMEASHQQFQKALNHHPALSDFLLAFQDDVRKQLAKENVAVLFPPTRNRRDVIREKNVMHVLNNADYDEDGDLLDLVTLLGILIQGYVAGLRTISLRDDADRTEETIDLSNEAAVFDWNEELERNEPENDNYSFPSTSSQSFPFIR